MRLIGNILLLPLRIICLIGFLFSLIGFVLATVFDHLSSFVIGLFISLCVMIVIGSLFFLETGIKDNPASIQILVAFGFTVVIALIPLLFEGLMSFFKKGLLFWF
jgi:hypothetical protein